MSEQNQTLESGANYILQSARANRQKSGKNIFSFGNDFLDDATGGIFFDDLVIIGAKTGLGKTELATSIAVANSILGKKVYYIALEAYEGEITDRIEYRHYCHQLSLRKKMIPTYFEWRTEIHKIDSSCYTEAIKKSVSDASNIFIKYRCGKSYDEKDLQRTVMEKQDQTDIFILDHLHYVDTPGLNVNQEMTKLVQKINDLCFFYKKPFIVICHLRKIDKKALTLLPDEDDFHGSSNITKQATKVITIGTHSSVDSESNTLFPTLFRICKERFNGSAKRFVACQNYNIITRSYDSGYLLSKNRSEFSSLSASELPVWAKRAKTLE